MSSLGMGDIRAMRALSASLHPAVLGMPAPVWTMALWQSVGALLIGVSTVLFASSGQNLLVKLSVAGYGIVASVVLVLLRDRTPTSLLRRLVLLNILANGALIAVAPSAVGAIGNSIGFVSVAIYAAFWGSRALAGIAIALCFAVYLAAIVVSGRIETLITSVVTITVVCIGIAWVIRYLVDGLDRLATLDPLTGLMNRRGLDVALTRPQRRETAARTLVAIDLDGFKQVNDTRGHAAGDQLLREFGDALRAGLRTGDEVARLGGDEFVLVLAGTSPAEADQVLDRLRGATPIVWAAGAVEWRADEPFELALARADAALYEQKRAARP